MPLSRHFYELDEVLAALQQCLWIRPHRSRALFWLWELVVSHEEELATTILYDAWLQRGGGLFVRQLQALPKETSWVERCLYTMEAIQLAGSLNAIRLQEKAATADTCPCPCPCPCPSPSPFLSALDSAESISQEEATLFWHGFNQACRTPDKRAVAIRHLLSVQESLSADGIWLAINMVAHSDPTIKCLETTASPHPESQLLHQITAALILCTPRLARYTEEAGFHAGHYRNDWNDWNKNLGRRAARLHAIPIDAAVVRANIPVTYSNIDDVRNPTMILSEGCKFWQEVMGGEGCSVDSETDTLVFPTDEAKESFYARYFPDDTPDEWSLEDQRKSHGPGQQKLDSPRPPSPS